VQGKCLLHTTKITPGLFLIMKWYGRNSVNLGLSF
jgi:hypothetical protein